jgi:hypothetical protein
MSKEHKGYWWVRFGTSVAVAEIDSDGDVHLAGSNWPTRIEQVELVERIAPPRNKGLVLSSRVNSAKIEDSGQAYIVEVNDPEIESILVRVQGCVDWKPEHKNIPAGDRHPILRSMIAKKITVTIEWDDA